MPTDVREIRAADAGEARAIAEAALRGSAMADGGLSALSTALDGEAAESRAMVATLDDALAGVAVYGFVAGARGAGRVYFVAVAGECEAADAEALGRLLADAVMSDLAARGARFALAELPDEPSVAGVRGLLLRSGFREESRVPDFYRDGIALTFLRRDVAGVTG